MIEVMVYVEGSSDKAAMEGLLKQLIEYKQQSGVQIQFFEAPPGDKKASVMRKVPKRAVNILGHNPNAIVVAMPDLYPLNKELPHENVPELQAVIINEFKNALKAKGLSDDRRYLERFKVFVFKYDLEALILAAEEALALRLGTDSIGEITWKKPVEDQNNDTPPKRVVQALFEIHNDKYTETVDAPLILSLTDYRQIMEACPQCFKPFVDFLESLQV